MSVIRSNHNLTFDQKKVARAAVKVLDNVFNSDEYWFDFYPDRAEIWLSEEDMKEAETGQSTSVASIYVDKETGDIILEMDGYGSPEILNVNVDLADVFF